MLTRLRVKYPRAFQLVAVLTALSQFMWACTPALAVTPAGTVITHTQATITSTEYPTPIASNAPGSATVMDVYGAEWLETATGSVVVPGNSAMYKFVFRNTGNLDTASASSTFYYSATGAWVEGIYLDEAGTTPATGALRLPPNANAAALTTSLPGDPASEHVFYVKVSPPVEASEQTETTVVTVENRYYQANSDDDPYGDPDSGDPLPHYGSPDRAAHSVVTTTTDNVPPVLSLTSPADGEKLTTVGPAVVGTTEAGAVVEIVAAGSTYSVTADASGAFSKTVSLSQGANTITATAKDAAGNVSTPPEELNVAVDSIPPTALIDSPVEGASLVGSVSVQGTADDTNFTEYSLHYGPGTSPTAWGTVTATSTIPVDGGTLGTWDTSRLYGPYTLRLIAEDSYGHVTVLDRHVSVGNADTLGALLPRGQWTMLALPGEPHQTDPRLFLGDSRYEAQWWDPTDTEPDPYLLNYKRAGEFVISGAGFGFWVKPYEQDISFSVGAWVTDTTEDYPITVRTGWNQVGAPYDRSRYSPAKPAIVWGNFRMKRTTGEEKTMAEAVAAGWINSSFYAYRNGAYVELGAGDTLAPYEGYFVKAYVDGELLINPGAGMPEGVARIIRPQYEWKVQIAAESASGRDDANYAAMVRGATDEFDPMDSGEPPIVRPYVSVYFPNHGWSRNAGKYAKDVRGAEMKSPEEGRAPEKEWRFVVETSSPGEEVRLRVPNTGELPLNYEFSIRDTVTGHEYDPRTYAQYTFSDASGSREFVLKARKLGTLPEVELPVDMPAGWSMISVPLEPEETDIRAQLGDDLDQITVFQYYDREMYHPESEEKVDIQAGIGYWMHLEVAQRVDFKGVRTDASKPVEVPLVVGWNLIGNPYEDDMAFGDNVSVRAMGEEVALSEAVGRGWVAVPMYTYMNPEARYMEVGQGDTLKAWRGYAIRALVACDIIMKP